MKQFTTNIRVYWCDCDAAGIAYYGNFFRYLEMAEEDLYRAQGQDRGAFFREQQVGFPRVEVACRYRKPARLDDLLSVTMWFEKRTRTGLVLRYELRRQGETDLVAEATSRLVCVNRQFKPVPLPEKFVSMFGDYLPPATTHIEHVHA